MPTPSKANHPAPATGDWTGVALRVLASVKLAIVLLVVLLLVLAVTTIVERSEGSGYVQWYVYDSTWFTALFGLLAANIVAAAVVRLPWKRRHIGFLIAHAGILVLMLGAMLAVTGKIEGRLALVEGDSEAGDRILLADNTEVNIQWQDVRGRPARVPASFAFKPGPVDWPEGKQFDLHEKSGVHLRVTKYLCRSRVEQEWVADESQDGQPALELTVAGSDGATDKSGWLLAGDAAKVGEDRLGFHRLKVATMLDDFLKPPGARETDSEGVLSVHYDGKMQRIPVGPNVGKKIPLGDGKVSVEIVEYLPNAVPGPAKPGVVVNFVSQGTKPENPLLELRVHVDGEKEPLREIAFANAPFQNFDEMHGRKYPVKFWYHHPAAVAVPGAEFVQTPDGKVYCRVGIDGKYLARGPIRAGDEIELPDKIRVTVAQHLPSARSEVSFHAVPYSAQDRRPPPPAVRLEVTAGGETQEVWLRYDDEGRGTSRIDTPQGPLSISLGDYFYPLGFSLRLLKLNREFDPGGEGDPVVSSTVRLVDKSQEVDEEREIGMNSPLQHGGFRFYQVDTGASPDGRPVSILKVATDPGRILKYLGSVMICVGILFVFFRKAPFGPAAANEKTLSTDRDAPTSSDLCSLSADQS